jgi:hypothetical protein
MKLVASDMTFNLSYPQGFTDSVINSKGSSPPSKEEKLLGSMHIP